MKTENQLTEEIYNVLNAITNTFWISRPTSGQSMPFIVYKALNTEGMYSFGINREAEDRTYQIELYISPSEVVSACTLTDSIKTAMESLDYRLIPSQGDFLETEINKVVKITRWEKMNA